MDEFFSECQTKQPSTTFNWQARKDTVSEDTVSDELKVQYNQQQHKTDKYSKLNVQEINKTCFSPIFQVFRLHVGFSNTKQGGNTIFFHLMPVILKTGFINLEKDTHKQTTKQTKRCFHLIFQVFFSVMT